MGAQSRGARARRQSRRRSLLVSPLSPVPSKSTACSRNESQSDAKFLKKKPMPAPYPGAQAQAAFQGLSNAQEGLP
jgi:hypothetical protein